MDDETLKKKLNPEQYRVMRQKDTERPFSGKYWDNDEHGVYTCAACDSVLFASLNQFDAKKGHPTFTAPVRESDIVLAKVSIDGVMCTEVMCKKCGSHLGYTAEDDRNKTYYVINSASLTFALLPEIEKEEGEDTVDEKKEGDTAPKNNPAQNVSWQSILVLLTAVLAGAGLGNVYGGYMCEIETPYPTQTLPADSQESAAPVVPVLPTTPTSLPVEVILTPPPATTTPEATSSDDGTGGSLPSSTSSDAAAQGMP